MSEKIEFVTLDDGKEYMITAEIDINNIKYVYLTSESDIATFCIRKVNNINNDEYLVALDSKEEVEMALKIFTEKYKSN